MGIYAACAAVYLSGLVAMYLLPMYLQITQNQCQVQLLVEALYSCRHNVYQPFQSSHTNSYYCSNLPLHINCPQIRS